MKNSNYISIRQYLESKGINPVKDRGYYGMYNSPFRKDTNPSFKVDYEKDLWHDFGTGKGGSIIDLVMNLENCSLAEAFQRLDDNSFSFQRNNNIAPPIPIVREPAIKIRDILPLTHLALLRFLNEQRCISTDIAKRYCSEVHYSVADKPYFAIGFQNNAGGWELRNRDFQGTASPKNIKTINNGSDIVMVFEGFMDFLSYLMLKQNPSPTIDTVVLNSTANLSKAIPFLQSYRTTHAFLDNDEAGRKSLVSLHELLTSSEVIDHSGFYRNHKDLNEYLQNKCKPRNQAMETKAAVQIKRQIPMKKKGRGL
ncbi:MAG: toprim domain-containing protein [Parabacteroides sp.]|nr:toprim domain-containing protein [Parabacteroides sp.]